MAEIEEIEEPTLRQQYLECVADGDFPFGACASCGDYMGAEWAEYDGEETGYLCPLCYRREGGSDDAYPFYEYGDYPDDGP